jgi:hypothetical protein
MKNKLFLILSVLLILVFSITSASCNQSGSNEIKIVQYTMTVQKFSSNPNQSLAVVSGQAQNISDKIIPASVVTVEFYDKDMKLLNTSSAVYENLQPGSTWSFGVQFMGPDAWKTSKYKISADIK